MRTQSLVAIQALLLLVACPASTTRVAGRDEVPDEVDVVVVGAGYAGMAAAHRILAKSDLSVAVLEAEAHVGGRVRNFDLYSQKFDTDTDNIVEVGGTFISPSHTALIELGKEVGVAVYNVSGKKNYKGLRKPLPEHRFEGSVGEPSELWPWWYWGVDTNDELTKESVFFTSTGRHLFRGPKGMKNMFINATWDELEHAGKMLQKLVVHIDCNKDNGTWFNYDAVTFEAWILANIKHEEARATVRNMCRGMIAQEPAQVSFLSTLKSLKGCWSGGDDDQYRFRGGTQAPLLRLQERLQGQLEQEREQGGEKVRRDGERRGGARTAARCSIVLSSPVRALRIATTNASSSNGGSSSNGQPQRVITVSGDGFSVRARHVILTGPPPIVSQIAVTPAQMLGPIQAQLLQRMPMGSSLKYFVSYKSPWWREAKSSSNRSSSSSSSSSSSNSSNNNSRSSSSGGFTGAVMASAFASQPQHTSDSSSSSSSSSWSLHMDACQEHSPYSGTVANSGAAGKGEHEQAEGNGTKAYALMCWVEGETSNHFRTYTAAEQRAHVLRFLRAAFDDARAETLAMRIVAHDWARQPYARGAYTGYFAPGVQSQPEFWEAYSRLATHPTGGYAPGVWLAGSDYQVGRGNGYMDGAVRSGYTAADTIIRLHDAHGA